MIKKENSAIYALRLFVGLKRIIEGSVLFWFNHIIRRRRIVKSTYVIKNRFIMALLFWEVIAEFCFLSCFYSRTFTIHRTAGKGRGYFFNFHPLHRHWDISRRLLQRAHLCTYLAAGLEPGTFDFRAQVANH